MFYVHSKNKTKTIKKLSTLTFSREKSIKHQPANNRIFIERKKMTFPKLNYFETKYEQMYLVSFEIFVLFNNFGGQSTVESIQSPFLPNKNYKN